MYLRKNGRRYVISRVGRGTHVMRVRTNVSSLRCQALTGHDDETAGIVGRCYGMKERQGEVRRDVERTTDAEHLEM